MTHPFSRKENTHRGALVTLLLSGLLALGAVACGSDDDDEETDSTPSDSETDTGDAGDEETDAGDDDTEDTETEDDTGTEEDTGGGFTCTPEMNDLAAISTPSPLISVDATVAASENVTSPESAVNGLFHSGGSASFGTPTEDAPEWISIEVGGGYTRLLVLWADAGWTEYNVATGGAPLDYSILVSEDSTDGTDGTWEEAVAVTDNAVRTRSNSIDVSDAVTWVRMQVAAGQPDGDAMLEVILDEISIFDISASDGGMIDDGWLVLGDSITKMSMETATESRMDSVIADSVDGFTPVLLPAAIGGTFATTAIDNYDEWMEINPNFKHVTLAYGTNDLWGKSSLPSSYETNMRTLIERLLEDGRVPHIPSIPYAPEDTHSTLPEANAMLQGLIEEYKLPCGPDLYTFFKKNQDIIDPNDTSGVHPGSRGKMEINRLWAESAVPLYETK